MSYPNIAFIGKAGAGKTTAAELLVKYHGYDRKSFAAPLKEVAVRIWGPGADTDREKLQRLGVAVRDIDTDAWCNILAREVEEAPKIQRLYSKVSRNTGSYFKPEGHTLPAPSQMIESREEPVRFTVDDLRFPNEFWTLRGIGFKIVRIEAPRGLRIERLKQNGKFQSEEQLEHISETALDTHQEDALIVNNMGPEQLLLDLEDLLKKWVA